MKFRLKPIRAILPSHATAILSLVALGVTASADVVVTGETNNAAGFTVSSTDLLQTYVVSTTDSISVNAFENNAIGGTTVKLTDGTFGATGSGGGICINGGSVTYYLDTPGSAPGYDISEVNVYTGWNDDGRDGQNYTVSYSTVADPTTFVNISTVTRDESGKFEKTSVTESTSPNLLATGVKAIRITFNSQENGGVGYKEIDVLGSTSVILPRNLTWSNSATTNTWNTTDANWTGSLWENSRPDNAIFGSIGGAITLDTITAGSVNVGNTGSNFADLTFAGGSMSAASLTVQGKGEPGGNGGNYGGNPTLSLNSDLTISGDAAIGRANLAVTNGTFTANRIISAPASADWGRLVVSGGSVTATNGVDGAVNTTATFAIDLNGGALLAPSINVADREAGPGNNAWLTFNGGTLMAIGPNNANFITTYGGGTNTYVAAAGAIIDTNGRDIGILINLLDAGGGGLTKNGAGTLTLTGANTYTGATSVNAGTLKLGNGTANTSLADTADVVVATGATLALDFTTPDTVDELWLGGIQKSPGTYTAANSSGFITGVGALVVQNGPAASDYDIWLAGYPSITDSADKLPGADPDDDGLINQLEYAFGLAPDDASSCNPITNPLDKATRKFSYTRRATPATTGLSYSVWTSENLTDWMPDATASEGSPVLTGQVQTVEITLSPLAPATLTPDTFFIQVRAE